MTTSDGYTLQIFNLRSKSKFNPNLNPVLLQHPIGSSALSWLVICETRSPAIVLAKKGCDVYLANGRGSAYSLGHDVHNIDSYEYWDFSFQELAWDYEANLTYIFEKTGKKVHTFGHSQGGTALLAGLSDPKKELADSMSEKIEMVHALAPVVLIVRINLFTDLKIEINQNVDIETQLHW